jgi:hypothetical protein
MVVYKKNKGTKHMHVILPLALSEWEEICEVLACLVSRRSEDVSIFFGRASVHYEDLLHYWFH